jgi:cycloeucalenol cycloisomerase
MQRPAAPTRPGPSAPAAPEADRPIAPGGRWFSRNPSKAWGEKFFLLYTPWWMLGMATLMQSGVGARWGDVALNLAMLVLLAPLVAVPALLHDESGLGRPWWRTYWFKLNVWIGIFAAIGSYFGSEYFFDVLGMVYNYPQLHWRLDSVLLGSGTQTVPLIMYTSAHFYFVTYHTAAVVVMRRVRTSRRLGRPWLWPLTVLGTAYFFAWAETFFMTDQSIAAQFYYRDLPRMLRWGSLCYACYFFVSFPMIYRLDEEPSDNWSLRRTAVEALAAGMLVLLLLDTVPRFVGRLS